MKLGKDPGRPKAVHLFMFMFYAFEKCSWRGGQNVTAAEAASETSHNASGPRREVLEITLGQLPFRKPGEPF